MSRDSSGRGTRDGGRGIQATTIVNSPIVNLPTCRIAELPTCRPAEITARQEPHTPKDENV
ncbi:MAG: hypothetical protein ACK4I8_06995, partial [Armatimonadota bacterium]